MTGYAAPNYDKLNLSNTLTLDSSSILEIDLNNQTSPGSLAGVISYASRSGSFVQDSSHIVLLHNPAGLTAAPVYNNHSMDVLIGNVTVVNMASSAGATVFGQPVSFTVQVMGAGTPTGTVTLQDGSTALATALLSGGSTTLTYAGLHVTGSAHTIMAVYSGDGNFTGSTSAAVIQTVSQDSTTTTLALSSNPSVFGQPITFTATVSPVSPGTLVPSGGLVTFYDGTVSLGTASLASGSATYTTGALDAGTHSIGAVYSAGSDFSGSTAPNSMLTVNQASTTLSVMNAVNPSGYFQNITFTATVSPQYGGMPTGTVTFMDNSTLLTTSLLSGGVATGTTSTLSQGAHTITAVYGGDSNFSSSDNSAAPFVQTVTAAQSATSVTASTNPVVDGGSVTLTATVTVNSTLSLQGTVTFLDSGTPLGTAGLAGSSGSTAAFTTTALQPSGTTHALTAVYNDSTSNIAGSTSGIYTQTVRQTTTTTVTCCG